MCYVLASGSGGISEVLDINVNVQISLKDTHPKRSLEWLEISDKKKKNLSTYV